MTVSDAHTLLILRHAHAEKPVGGMQDFVRALDGRGRLEAASIAEQLETRKSPVGHILCSTAVRTQETLSIIRNQNVGEGVEVTLTDDLYHGRTDALDKTLAALCAAHTSLMIIGHNPLLPHMVMALTGGMIPQLWQRKMADFKPCTLVALTTHDADQWRRLSRGSFRLDHMLTPQQ